MLKLGILGSTRGTNLLPILEAIQQKKLDAHIEVVISNKADAIILERARANHLQAEFVDPAGCTREEFDQRVSALLRKHQVDLVVLIGYMRILSNHFVTEWRKRIINIHPSLLPAYAGGMDLAVHADVIAAGEKESGCTVHYVTEVLDGGPIVVQKSCPVLADDVPETLKVRVQALEGIALVEAIQLINLS